MSDILNIYIPRCHLHGIKLSARICSHGVHKCRSLFLRADQILIESDSSRQTVILNIFVQSMHSLHLLRSIDHRCKTDTALTDRLIELCICRACHNIRAGRQSRESICDGLLHQMECFSVNIHRRRIIIGMQHFGLQTVFVCHFLMISRLSFSP